MTWNFFFLSELEHMSISFTDVYTEKTEKQESWGQNCALAKWIYIQLKHDWSEIAIWDKSTWADPQINWRMPWLGAYLLVLCKP